MKRAALPLSGGKDLGSELMVGAKKLHGRDGCEQLHARGRWCKSVGIAAEKNCVAGEVIDLD